MVLIVEVCCGLSRHLSLHTSEKMLLDSRDRALERESIIFFYTLDRNISLFPGWLSNMLLTTDLCSSCVATEAVHYYAFYCCNDFSAFNETLNVPGIPTSRNMRTP